MLIAHTHKIDTNQICNGKVRGMLREVVQDMLSWICPHLLHIIGEYPDCIMRFILGIGERGV